ncbi:hypothetical protein HC931_26140 [Candidatus Gracilibacteria bacterium]|nr:hypothetical protein [Candidatus Gracilibacteria bacterium]
MLPTLQSCDLVAAVLAQGGELTLKAKDNWDYAAKVMPPELIKQVRQNFEAHWIGDPKRFQAVKVQQFGQKSPLYFIDPYIPCPESGCTSQELYDLYHPGCNVSGGCLKFAYVQQENGTFRRVFEQLFYQQPTADDVFFEGFFSTRSRLSCLFGDGRIGGGAKKARSSRNRTTSSFC